MGIIIIKLLTGRNIIDFDNWHESLDVGRPRVTSCIEIARNCIEADQDQRPTIGEIIRELDEMESMIQELTDGTKHQVGPMPFPSTELLDVYPLELSFPFQPNQQLQHELQCQVSLINKTDGEVAFFVIPDHGARIMPVNGILMPMSTSVFTLTMLMSRKMEPLLGSSDEVLILMFVMRSSDDVRQLMKTSVDEDGELNMPIDDLYKQVQQLGGETHRTTLAAAVQHDTRSPSAKFLYSTRVVGSNRIMSVDVHPTEPWILVLATFGVYIWNWQTKQKIHLNIRQARLAKFIARKKWLVIGKKQSIHVYKCPTLDQINEVMQFRVQDSERSDCYMKLAVHPSRPFVMSYGRDNSSVASMKLWNWEQNWSCTQIFDVTSLVLQVMFNTKDTNTFTTLSRKYEGVNSVKIWKFDRSTPIATMPEGLEGTKLASVFTRGADQHLITAIRGSCAEIWDLHKGERVHTLSIHGGHIVAVACHPKHPVLVTSSSRGTIRVWDCNTYRLKKEYVGNEWSRLHDLAFLESGRLVVICESEVGILDIDVD